MKRGGEIKGKHFTSFRVCCPEMEEELSRRSIDKNRLQACVIRNLNSKWTSPNKEKKSNSCRITGHRLQTLWTKDLDSYISSILFGRKNSSVFMSYPLFFLDTISTSGNMQEIYLAKVQDRHMKKISRYFLSFDLSVYPFSRSLRLNFSNTKILLTNVLTICKNYRPILTSSMGQSPSCESSSHSTSQ
jgi:hypothetical protein